MSICSVCLIISFAMSSSIAWFGISVNNLIRQMYGEVSHIQIWVCRLSRKKVTLLGMEGYVA